MIRFNCDYLEGAHPRILERLAATNMEQTVGYGCDDHSERARELIKKVCACPTAAVHFLVGGTQANFTVISAALRPYQGVIAADTGHIACHETGAVEACGYKVLTVPGDDGRVTAEAVDAYVREHWANESHEHVVQPKMVYISMTTEIGTIYTKKDLAALYAVCRQHGLYLFLDGARLGYGLATPGSDLDLPFIAAHTDVFYIGGTKVGALFGEAVVLVNPALQPEFRYLIKQKGGMLAKGRLLGIQFETLFEDGLYFEISRHALEMAGRLRQGLEALRIPFASSSVSNQQFVRLDNAFCRELRKTMDFDVIQPGETESIVRFCTSWATLPENIDALLAEIQRLKNK